MLRTRHTAHIGAPRPNTVLVLILAAVALSFGCAESTETTAPESLSRPEFRRSGEAVLKRMSDDIPTFAGFFLDNGRPVLLVTDMSSDAQVRDAFRSVRDEVIPAGVRLTGDVEVRLAKYSFTQLARWRDVVYESVFSTPGVVSLDLNEGNNRIEIGLATSAEEDRVRALLSSLDLPLDAVATEVTGPLEVGSSLRDFIRPVVGGLEVWRVGFGTSGCSAGFNFKIGTDTTDYLMTASHCTLNQWGLDGGNWYQPENGAPKLIGAEGVDPNSFVCGNNVCRYSDAAGIDYSISGHKFGFIARTTIRLPDAGTIIINGLDPRMQINFEYHGSMQGLTVDKMGQATGWTYGTVTNTCVTVTDGEGNEWRCHNKATYGHADGDSGSPVFVWQGSTVQLAGIHVGDHGGKALYSTMDGIETDFGAIETFYSVFISGPGGVWSSGTYMWEAFPSPSSGSHSYQWKVKYLSTGNTVTLGTGKTQELYIDGSTGHLLLSVTSTFAQTGSTATHERVISNNIGGGPEQPASGSQ